MRRYQQLYTGQLPQGTVFEISADEMTDSLIKYLILSTSKYALNSKVTVNANTLQLNYAMCKQKEAL